MKKTRTSQNPESLIVSRFWVIDTETPGEHERSRSAIGPFDTVEKAEQWLKEDAEELFLSTSGSLREQAEDDWGAPMIIVEERKTVKQVPTVKVTVRLEPVSTPII